MDTPAVTCDADSFIVPDRLRARVHAGYISLMQTLGEDILLLAIRQNGTIAAREKMRFALAGSELVRLAALRRVDVVKGQIVVIDPEPTQDPLLDAAFASMQGSRRPPRAKDWVARVRGKLTQAYLERMAASGAVRLEIRKSLGIFPVKRWYVVDSSRVRRLKAQLDTIAISSGPVDSPQAAFGGLVHAIGLDLVLYPKGEGRPARKRLEWIAKHNDAADAVRGAVADASTTALQASVVGANLAAVNAATQAATAAAIDAATQAAVQASVAAAVGASIDAAVSASVEAAHHSSTDGGHHHG
jgi:hypothetical protein